MLITSDRPASPILSLIKSKRSGRDQETWRRPSDRAASFFFFPSPHFCFISKEKQGQYILGNRAHKCVSLLLTCKFQTIRGGGADLVTVCVRACTFVCVFHSHYIGLTRFKCVKKKKKLKQRNV